MAIAADIERLLSDSAAAWSRGDLDGFLACYEDGPQTLYVSAQGVVRGLDTIRDMYRARFSDGGLGRLALDLAGVERMDAAVALAVGRYRLAWPDRPEASGVFSIVLRWSGEGWRIVADHSS